MNRPPLSEAGDCKIISLVYSCCFLGFSAKGYWMIHRVDVLDWFFRTVLDFGL
jgi:hypothetical protein